MIQGEDYKSKIPANNRTVRDWRKNMEVHGSVMAPRNGSKARVRPTLLTASLDAPNESQEHRLAIKKGHYDAAIPEVRGKCIVYCDLPIERE